MKGKIVEQGTYVIIECPHCGETKILYDDFNPDDSSRTDLFEGEERYCCESCNKFFDIDFGFEDL